MAKALLGYVGGSDLRLLAEMRRLQQRVQDLESELGRIQAENDDLRHRRVIRLHETINTGRRMPVRPPVSPAVTHGISTGGTATPHSG